MLQEELDAARPAWHPLSPGSPWIPVADDTPRTGRVISYYSNGLESVPIRDVRRTMAPLSGDGVWADQKSDPNLETMTFGMWSTCDRPYRQTMGDRNGRVLFFRTQWPKTSHSAVIAGFYDVGWLHDSWCFEVPQGSTSVSLMPDRLIAARRAHFVKAPIPIHEAAEQIGVDVALLASRPVRALDESATGKLQGLLEEQEDATREYIKTIRRVEQSVWFYSRIAQLKEPGNPTADGFRYLNWRRRARFDWSLAEPCFSRSQRGEPTTDQLQAWNDEGIVANHWRCDQCDARIQTFRPIKICSECTKQGIMVPVTTATLKN